MFFRRKKEPKPLAQIIEERETREGKTRPIPWRPLHLIGALTILFIFIFSCGSVIFYFMGPELGDEGPPPTPEAKIPEEYVIRGSMFADEGEFDSAIRDFTEAINLRPDYDSAYYNRGLTYIKLEQYPEAIADFSAAIAIIPEHQGAHVWRAISYTLMGRDDEAEADVSRAIELGVDGGELRARIEGAKLNRESSDP